MKMRRMVVGMSTICFFLGLMALSASAERGPQKSKGNYSIFDETIVDLSWPEVEQAAKDKAIILFPIGVIEEHGPHMSLGVDTYVAYLKCKLLRRELERRGIHALIAPPFYWGINVSTGVWAGSFVSRPSTVSAVLDDALASLRSWGFLNVFFVNHHGNKDHSLAICDAIEKARVMGTNAFYLMRSSDARPWGIAGKEYILIQKDPPPPSTPPPYVDPHAGKGETSIMAYYFPDQVDLDLARTLAPFKLTAGDFAKWRTGGWEVARKMTPLGYIDDPASFDPKAGKEAIEEFVGKVADVIESSIKGTYRPPTP